MPRSLRRDPRAQRRGDPSPSLPAAGEANRVRIQFLKPRITKTSENQPISPKSSTVSY
jgi:hypothetical protein